MESGSTEIIVGSEATNNLLLPSTLTQDDAKNAPICADSKFD
jgi:hypothetical protein